MVFPRSITGWRASASELLLGLDSGQQFQKFSGLYYKQISTTVQAAGPARSPDHSTGSGLSGFMVRRRP